MCGRFEMGTATQFCRKMNCRWKCRHELLHSARIRTGISPTGNPYKGGTCGLIKRGVKVELCGATAKAHNYGNEDLLPDMKINTDAMSSTIQLVQEGFVKISES
jgi:hypothetical protein